MNRSWRLRRDVKRLMLSAVALALASSSLGLSCDQDAQAVFRQTATGPMGQGVKEFLGGDAEQAAGTILSAAVDGLIASIQQAGDGPSQ